jgi:hypothetical protein
MSDEAMKSPDADEWKQAIKEEYERMVENGV